MQRGYELNTNSSFSLLNLAFVKINIGDAAGGISLLHQALRISPRDPLRHAMHFQLARASFAIGQYASAVDHAMLGISEAPLIPNSYRRLAMSLVGLGALEKAKAALLRGAPASHRTLSNGGWRAIWAMTIRNSIEEV